MNRDRFLDHRATWKLHRRLSLRQRNATARQEWYAVFTAGLCHLAGPVPAVGEVLVIEDRDDAAGVLHHLQDLVEEPLARVHRLAQFCLWIAPVLADGEHGIDRQLVTAQAECLPDRLVDRDTVTL